MHTIQLDVHQVSLLYNYKALTPCAHYMYIFYATDILTYCVLEINGQYKND